MTTFNEVKDFHMSLITGDDAGAGSGLIDWINGKGAFVVGETIPSDLPLGWFNKPPTKVTTKQGTMTTSKVSGRYSKNRQLGEWVSKHALQTSQFAFWITQTTGTPTNEGTPAGFNTHTLPIGLPNAPQWHGIHFEREGITSNELRYDLMGFCPQDLVINCSPTVNDQKATQEITIPYAYLNISGADLDPVIRRDPQATGSLWKTWNHLVTGNGAGKVPSGLTYSGNQLEVDVTSFQVKLHRDIFIGGIPDTTGYFQDGLMYGYEYVYVLEVQPTGDLLYDLNHIAKEDYADLDYDFSFVADATNDRIDFATDKLYMLPFDEENDWNKYTESYTITLEPLDENSSLVITGIDNVDNEGFENP